MRGASARSAACQAAAGALLRQARQRRTKGACRARAVQRAQRAASGAAQSSGKQAQSRAPAAARGDCGAPAARVCAPGSLSRRCVSCGNVQHRQHNSYATIQELTLYCRRRRVTRALMMRRGSMLLAEEAAMVPASGLGAVSPGLPRLTDGTRGARQSAAALRAAGTCAPRGCGARHAAKRGASARGCFAFQPVHCAVCQFVPIGVGESLFRALAALLTPVAAGQAAAAMEGVSLRPGGAGLGLRPGGSTGGLLSAFALGSRPKHSAGGAGGKDEKAYDEVIKYNRDFLMAFKEGRLLAATSGAPTHTPLTRAFWHAALRERSRRAGAQRHRGGGAARQRR